MQASQQAMCIYGTCGACSLASNVHLQPASLLVAHAAATCSIAAAGAIAMRKTGVCLLRPLNGRIRRRFLRSPSRAAGLGLVCCHSSCHFCCVEITIIHRGPTTDWRSIVGRKRKSRAWNKGTIFPYFMDQYGSG